MNKTTNFKKFEKKVFLNFANAVSWMSEKATLVIKKIHEIGSQKLTIMLIPHSEKKVFNLRINLFLLTLIIISASSSLGVITFLSIDNYNKSMQYYDASMKTQVNEKKSREYKEILNEIYESHKTYKVKLNTLLTKLNSPAIKAMEENYNYSLNQGGPLNQIEKNNLSDIEFEKLESQKLLMDYKFSAKAFNEITNKLSSHEKITKDLPFGSPVRGPYFITSTFGLRIHPVFKVLDVHTGIDLANEFGTPIISTAPGTVEKVLYSGIGYGNHIIIRHKMGYSTLYAHLRSAVVIPGDQVKKNQIIGYMGNSGTVTGVHIHYEIRLANKPVDPWIYLNVD